MKILLHTTRNCCKTRSFQGVSRKILFRASYVAKVALCDSTFTLSSSISLLIVINFLKC